MHDMVGKMVQVDTDDGEVIVGPLVEVKDNGYIKLMDAHRIVFLPPWCIQNVEELKPIATGTINIRKKN